MPMIIELPSEIEQNLRRGSADFEQAGKEAMLVEFYRQNKVTRYQLSLALGLSRLETDALLKRHNVTEDLPSVEELERDLRQAAPLVRK